MPRTDPRAPRESGEWSNLKRLPVVSVHNRTSDSDSVAHVGDSPSVRDRLLVTRALRTRLRVPLLGSGLDLEVLPPGRGRNGRGEGRPGLVL